MGDVYFELLTEDFKQRGLTDWALASKLIAKNKEYASAGDPSVSSKIKYLKAHSYKGQLRADAYEAIRSGATPQDAYNISQGISSTTIREIPQQKLTRVESLPSKSIKQEVTKPIRPSSSIGPYQDLGPQAYKYDDILERDARNFRLSPLRVPQYLGAFAWRYVPESKTKTFLSQPGFLTQKDFDYISTAVIFSPLTMTGAETLKFYKARFPTETTFKTEIKQFNKGYIANTGSLSKQNDKVIQSVSSTYYNTKGKLSGGFGSSISITDKPSINEYVFITSGKKLAKSQGITKQISSVAYSQTAETKSLLKIPSLDLTTRVSNVITKPKVSSVLSYTTRPSSKGISQVYGTNIFKNLKPQTLNIRGEVIFKGSSDLSQGLGKSFLITKPITKIISSETATTQIGVATATSSINIFKSVAPAFTTSYKPPKVTTPIRTTPIYLNQDIISSNRKQRTDSILKIDYGQQSSGGQKTITPTVNFLTGGLITPPKDDQITTPKIITIPKIDQPMPTKTTTTLKYTPKPPFTPLPPIYPEFPTPKPPFKPFLFGSFGGLGLGSRQLKGGRRVTGYAPSFSALIFKIRGSVKKDITGIGLRPIPKNFSFTKRRRFDELF